MGRPARPLGTFGKIGFFKQQGGKVQARAKYRDYDGHIRLVTKIGRSKAAAERALREELASRRSPVGGGSITSNSRVAALADAWLEQPHGWSTGTDRVYRSMVKNQVNPASVVRSSAAGRCYLNRSSSSMSRYPRRSVA